MNDDEKRFLEQIQKENESAHAETRQRFETTAARFEQLHAETRQEFQATTADLKQEFQTTTADLKQEFRTTVAEIKQEFKATAVEMRRHFDTVAEDIAKKTHAEIQLLAESLAHVDYKVDVNSAKIDRLAADNEVFRAAFANVDRRLRVVEDIVLPQKPS
jgi:F0F1-type ATP synthase membrane subunit b/b'